MDRCSSGRRLSRRSTLTMLLAGGIGGLSVSRVEASDVVFRDVHGAIYAIDAADGTEQWKATTSSLTGRIVMTEETVYVISSEHVRALDRDSGEQEWILDDGMGGDRYSAPDQLPAITVQDGTRYINVETLYAVDAEWNIAWEYDLDDEYCVTPVVTDELVVVCRNNRRDEQPDQYELLALDVDDGEVVWAVERDSEITTKPLVDDGIVYVDASEESVDAYDLETGEPRDSDAPDESEFDDDSSEVVDRYTNDTPRRLPEDDDSSEIDEDGRLYIIDEPNVEAYEDGELLWSFDTEDIQDIDHSSRELGIREWTVHESVATEETVFVSGTQWDELRSSSSRPQDDGYTPPEDDITDDDSPDDDSTRDESPLGVKPALAGIVGLGVLGRLLSEE